MGDKTETPKVIGFEVKIGDEPLKYITVDQGSAHYVFALSFAEKQALIRCVELQRLAPETHVTVWSIASDDSRTRIV